MSPCICDFCSLLSPPPPPPCLVSFHCQLFRKFCFSVCKCPAHKNIIFWSHGVFIWTAFLQASWGRITHYVKTLGLVAALYLGKRPKAQMELRIHSNLRRLPSSKEKTELLLLTPHRSGQMPWLTCGKGCKRESWNEVLWGPQNGGGRRGAASLVLSAVVLKVSYALGPRVWAEPGPTGCGEPRGGDSSRGAKDTRKSPPLCPCTTITPWKQPPSPEAFHWAFLKSRNSQQYLSLKLSGWVSFKPFSKADFDGGRGTAWLNTGHMWGREPAIPKGRLEAEVKSCLSQVSGYLPRTRRPRLLACRKEGLLSKGRFME